MAQKPDREAELEQQNALLRVQLEDARQALETLSHEARTPLTGLAGMIELLLDSALAPTQRAWAESARVSSEQLRALIDDLLDHGRLDYDDDRPPTLFEPRETAEDVLARYGASAHGRNVELSLLIDQAVPRRLFGRVDDLSRVLARLVDNAVSFTRDGRVLVRILVHRHHDDVVDLWVEVSDSGEGIAPELHERIFRPLVQGDASTEREHQGPGLGLPVARRLVEAAGGTLGFDSEPGRGSRFWFTFPTAAATTADEPGDELLRDRRALVVSSQAAHRAELQLQLQELGMHADGASAGPAALARLRHRKGGRAYDVCVVDLKLDGMDGLSLASVMGQDPELSKLPVVLIASTPDQLDDARLKRIALAAVLTRPLRGRTLRVAIHRALDGDATEAERVPVSRQEEPAHILVAEDNPVTQRLLVASLERLGYRCDVADDGDEAVRRFEVGRYDAVLMDVQMPGADGLAATRRIRMEEAAQGARRTPILAITANVSLADRQRCLRAGMDDHIAKPFRLDELTAALSRWVNLDASMRSFSLSSEDADRNEVPTLDEEVVERLLETAGDDRAFHELVDLYLQQLDRALGSLREQLGEQLSPADLQRLKELEAASTMFGGRRLAVACLELRRRAGDEGLTGRTARLLRDVEREALELEVALKAFAAPS